MKDTNSRGKRNRIKRKIQRLNGEVPTESRSVEDAKSKIIHHDKRKGDASVDDLTAEEDSKVDSKVGAQVSKATQKLMNTKNRSKNEIIEDDIALEVKKNKRKRKQKKKEENENELDDVMKSFEDRINKRLKVLEEAGDDPHR
jgi:hypothetical protein